MPLPQIPNLQSRIVAAGKQVSPVWMEIDLVDFGTVCIVMLNQPLAPDVPNLDRLVLTTTGDAGAIWMESHRIHATVVVHELGDALSRRKVPELDGMVI